MTIDGVRVVAKSVASRAIRGTLAQRASNTRQWRGLSTVPVELADLPTVRCELPSRRVAWSATMRVVVSSVTRQPSSSSAKSMPLANPRVRVGCVPTMPSKPVRRSGHEHPIRRAAGRHRAVGSYPDRYSPALRLDRCRRPASTDPYTSPSRIASARRADAPRRSAGIARRRRPEAQPGAAPQSALVTVIRTISLYVAGGRLSHLVAIHCVDIAYRRRTLRRRQARISV